MRVTPEQARELDAANAEYSREYNTLKNVFSRPGEWAPGVYEVVERYQVKNQAILKSKK